MIRALLVAAVVLTATAAGGVAAEKYPIFNATDLDHGLAHVNAVSLEVYNLEPDEAPASIVVTTPGYTFAHVDPSDFIGFEAKPVGGGPKQRIFATLGAPTAVAVCVPGTHDLTWTPRQAT